MWERESTFRAETLATFVQLCNMKRRRLTREASTITNSTSANDEDYVLHTTTQKKAKGGKRKPRTSNVNVKAGTLRIPPAKPLVVNEDHSLEDRFSLSPLFNALGGELNGEENGEELDGGVPFEDILEDHLADIVEGRKRYLESTAERNQWVRRAVFTPSLWGSNKA